MIPYKPDFSSLNPHPSISSSTGPMKLKEIQPMKWTAQSILKGGAPDISQGHTGNFKKLGIDRDHLQKALIGQSMPVTASALDPFFHFCRNVVFRIKLIFGLIQEKPPEDLHLHFTILSKFVRAVPDQGTCPSSVLLSYTHEQIRQQNEGKEANGIKTIKDEELEVRLGKAAEWSKEIEKLQKDRHLRPNSKNLLAFINKLKEEMNQLQLDEKRLIPGGHQEEDGGFTDALYEVEKTSFNSFKVRILSLNEENKDYWHGEKDLENDTLRYNPILEFADVSLEQLQNSLEPLIHIQLPHLFQTKESENKGFFGERIQAIRRLFADPASLDTKINLTPLRIMTKLYEAPPKASEQNLFVKVPKAATFFKTLLIYMKSVNPNHYNATKLELELSALFTCVNEDTNALLNNQGLRDLVQVCAKKLMYELEKNQASIGLDDETYQNLMRDLKDLLILAQKLDQKTGKLAVPSIKLSPLEKTFKWQTSTDPDHLENVKESSTGIQEVSFKDLNIPSIDSIRKTVDAEQAKNALKAFKEQVQTVKNLYTKENYANMQALILDLANQLPPPTANSANTDFWKAILKLDSSSDKKIALETLKEWNDSVFELSQFLFDCQQLQGISPSPQDILANAHFLAIADRLMVLKAGVIPNNPFTLKTSNSYGFESIVYFDPKDIKNALQTDRYFRLTSANQHRMAENLLDYWNETEANNKRHEVRAPISLADWKHVIDYGNLISKYAFHDRIPPQSNSDLQAYIQGQAAQDYAYLTKFPGKGDVWDNIKQAFDDIEVNPDGSNILPPEVIQQRKMHLIMKGMLTQQHVFTISDPKEFLEAGNRLVKEAGGNVNALSQQEMWQKLWKIQGEKVQAKFKKNKPPIDSKTKERGHIRWSVNSEGEFALKPSGTRFLLAAYRQWKKWHSDQDFYREKGRYLDDYTHQSIVQFQIGTKNEGEQVLTQQSLVNRAQSEEERILRSMQTSESRLEQTFATFSEHPELLNTPSKQRLFELNIFKQGDLFKKISEQPAFARELLAFSQNNLELARGTRDIQRALFFVQLRDNVKEYVQLSTLPDTEKNNIIKDFPSPDDYEELLNICINDQEKRAVYEAYLPHYLLQIEKKTLRLDHLSQNDKAKLLNKIIKGYFLYHSLNVGPAGKNPETEKQIQCLMMRIRPHLKTMFEDKTFAQIVLQDLFGILKLTSQSTKISGEFPRFSVGKITVDFDKGLVFEKDKANGLLPNEILENETIQRLFKNKKTEMSSLSNEAQLEFKKDPKTGAEIIVYTFKHQSNLRLIQQADGKLAIQMKMHKQSKVNFFSKEKWYELTPFKDLNQMDEEDNDHQLPGEMADLVIRKFVWRELNHPTHVIVKDENNDAYLYDVHLKKEQDETWKLAQVKRFKDNLILVNPWINHQDLGSLTSIEDAAHIKVWGKEGGTIQEFEFPRIKMPDGSSLAYRTKKDAHHGNLETVLESVQFKNWIMPYQSAPLLREAPPGNLGIEILPHMFKDFQQLFNPHTGAKKVLIPLQQATREGLTGEESQDASQAKYAKWSDQVKLDHNSSSWSNQTLLEFEVDPIKKALKTDNKQANLFLAYLFFTSKRYEQAVEYLNASETSLAMSPSHHNIYQWIDTWGDKTPEGTAFKLKAALALKAHQLKQDAHPVIPEQQLMEASHLLDFFKEYEKVKDRLPVALQLTTKEDELYQRTLNQTYLPGFIKEPFLQRTVPVEATPWKEASTQTTRVTPFILTRELFIEMKGTTLSKDEFSLTSNKHFIQEFRALYEGIYQSDIDSDQYRKFKQLVELAQPASSTARGAQRILKGLIKSKELINKNLDPKIRKLLLEPLAFPAEFKQPYFMFSRIAALAENHQSVKLLQKLLETLDKSIKDEETTSPASSPKKDKLEDLPKPKYRFDYTALKVGIGFWEGIDLYLTKQEMDGQGIDSQSSPEQIVTELRKANKLDQLAQTRRLAELQERQEKVNRYLEDHPVAPLASVKPQGSPLRSPEKIMQYDRPMNDFFDVQVIRRSSQEIEKRIDEVTGFFKDYTSKAGNVPPSVQRLTQKYQDDTRTFIEEQKVEKITFKNNVDWLGLTNTVETTLDTVSKNRQKNEAQIVALIKPKKKDLPTAQDSLSPQLETVPQRLIGLYIDRRMQDVNKIMGLQLDEKQIKELEASVQEWMVATIQERMARRGLDQLRDILDPAKVTPEALQQLYQTLSPTRFFSIDEKGPDTHFRELLSIEFASGFILRANQVETINTMLGDPNQVKQLGLGQGKSSVILPMLLHRLADGQRAAIGILPEWLYEIVSGDLDKSSRALFDQDIFKFEFDRNTKMDREWLLNQYITLGEAIQNRNAIVTTKTFLLSFRNKFLELQEELETATGDDVDDLEEKLSLMADILLLFKKRGAVIADEVDAILDVRQELNYALGLPDKIDPKKCQMGLKVYRKILQLQSEYGDKLRKNEQGLLTAQDIENLKEQIALTFFKEWGAELAKHKPSIDKQVFCKYLQGKTDLGIPLKENTPLFMHAIKGKNLELYQNISLLRQYLTQTLPTTLSRSGNVHYGRAPDGKNTIPYKANNTPSEAEHGEEFERISYFIQDYLQNGLTETQVQSWVNGLLTQISSEMYEHLTKTGTIGAFENTPTYQRFHKDFPNIDLTQANQDPTILTQFLKELNVSDETKLNFLESWIFPSLEIANRQVSSNANDLVNMVNSFSGFTGTPWNTDTYNTKIHTQDTQTKGTEGKTIELLVNLFAAGNLDIHIINLDADRPLDSIVNAVPDFMDRYDSLIEAGYYLKGMDNKTVVQELGKLKSKKKAVVYVTTENEKVIQTLGRDDDAQPLQNRKDIKMEERLTYYDQFHTIGTDIPHAKTARAALTIGEKMYIKDLFQSLWRKREIDKGQKVDLFISHDIAQLIKKARSSSHPDKNSDIITIQDVLLFCIKNQAERETEDNLRAERQRIMGIVPDNMFWQLVRVRTNQTNDYYSSFFKKDLFESYKNFLFKQISSKYDAFTQVSLPEETHKVLNHLRNQLIDTFEDVKDEVGNLSHQLELEAAIEELRNYRLLDANKLPEKTEAVSKDAKDSQVQTQRQQQQQISIEAQAAIIPPDPNEMWNGWSPDNLQELWNISQTMEQANQGVPFLDSDIRLTPNFAPKNEQTDGFSLSDRLLGSKRIRVAQVLVLQDTDTDEWRTILLDIEDYERVVRKLMKPDSNQRYKAGVFDVRPQKGNLLLCSTKKLNTNPWNNKEMETVNEKLVKIKVFNRQVNFYDGQEVQALKSWVAEDREQLKEYFEAHLLTPSLQSAYKLSTLAKAFAA